MKTKFEIEELEDHRVYMQAKVQGPVGITTAKRYANQLMENATTAFAEGDLDTAIWLTEREANFNRRVFGFNHPYSLSSHACVKALRQHKQAVAQQLAIPKKQRSVA